MKTTDVNLRVCATGHLNVGVGDRIRQGDLLYTGPGPQEQRTSPVSGIVRDIQFDPGNHEFVIRVTPTGKPGL